MDAENTHQVYDWLWTSGQISQRDIASLPALGIEAVINIALPASSNALPGEVERVTGLSLTYVYIPVDWERPQELRARRGPPPLSVERRLPRRAAASLLQTAASLLQGVPRAGVDGVSSRNGQNRTITELF